MKKSPLSLRSLPLLLALAATASPQVRAASATWNGLSDDWTLSSNWVGSPAVVPGTGDTATFGATGSATVTPPGVSLLNLNFTAVAQPYTISGTLSFDAGSSISMAAGSAAQSVGTISSPLGSLTFTNNSTNLFTTTSSIAMPTAAPGTVTFSGDGSWTGTNITGGSQTKVIKEGAGVLTLTAGSTSITGTVEGDGYTVRGGTLKIQNANAASNRVMNIENGGTLENTANNAQSQYTLINIVGSGRLFYNNATNNWQVGAAAGVLKSAPGAVLTFDALATSAIRLNASSTAFNGTWQLSDKVALRLSNVNSAGTGITMNMGSNAGTHIVEVLSTQQDTATLAIKPLSFGALTGLATDAILRGRQSNTSGGNQTNTPGVQWRVGAMNTDTTYAGMIADGNTVNGLPDGTGSWGLNNGPAGSNGTVEFVKEGTGALTLTGTANTHTGGTVLSGGTLAISGDGALGAAYDGTLRLFSVIPGVGTYTALPAVSISGGGGSGAVVSLFSSTNSPTASGTYYMTFGSTTSNNTQTGSGYTSQPSITVTRPGTSPETKATVRVKGLLTFDGGTLKTNAAVTSNRATVLTSNNGTIHTNGFDSTFSGIFNGAGGLTKSGAGTLTMSGASTYTGATAITGGRLCLTGSLVSSVTVSAGATFAGSGNTTGAVVNNGTLTAGCSVGALGTGALTLAAASAVGFEVADWAGSAGTGYDTVNAASLDITATSGSPITINVSELALANYDGTSKSFTLVATTGGITGFAADKFSINSVGFTSGAGPWSVAVSGNNLVLNYTGSASPYDTWASGFGLAGADALKTADPEKDGLSNIAEFGFNSSPVAGTAPGGPNGGGIKPVTGGDALTLTIRVRSGAVFTGATALTATKDGVKYTIQGSADLSAWTADIDEVLPALTAGLPAPDSGWEYRTFRFASTTATTARAMIRALAEQP